MPEPAASREPEVAVIIELLLILADPDGYVARWNAAGELELRPRESLPPSARIIERKRR